jgi:hypothetical protein
MDSALIESIQFIRCLVPGTALLMYVHAHIFSGDDCIVVRAALLCSLLVNDMAEPQTN